jgi:membrane associated rhomboid family serine protease
MIPLSDENPPRTKPYVVYVLILLNVAVYIYGFFDRSLQSIFSMIPYGVIHDQRIIAQPVVNQLGQLVGYRRELVPGIHPQWVTVFTSMFLHASLLHIAGNMLFLWIFGNNIEDALGRFRFLLFYVSCGVLAALAHIAVSITSIGQFVPTVGASGAIAGVLGAYLYLYPGNRVQTLVLMGFFWTRVEIPAVLVLGVWFVTQLLGLGGSGGQAGGGVAYGAHVGGFLAGVILIILLGGRALRRPRPRFYRRMNRYERTGW